MKMTASPTKLRNGMILIRMPRKKKKAAKKRPVPTNKRLYAQVKSEAKRKFRVYPSAYANGWLVKTYKARGGKYRMGTK